jgi:hypothetical protein
MAINIKKIFACLSVCFITTGCSFFIEENTYYIPQAKIYVKTILRSGENYGYILFSNDSIMNLSEDIDYIKSSTDLSAIFVLKQNNSDTIGLYYNGNILKVNQIKFHFTKYIRETDTLYYEKRHLTNPLILKYPYFEFVIDNYFHTASIKKPGAEYYDQVYPIR